MKYTKELLQKVVRESVSIAGVLRKLGLALNSGGTHYYISRKIKEFGINTSHFLGPRTNSGNQHKGGSRRRSPGEILTFKTSGYGEKTAAVRRALLEIGREYVCDTCGQIPFWNNKPLTLQIEHENGNSLDDRPENVIFNCPNCHTQTGTYGKIKTSAKIRKCRICNGSINRRNRSGVCCDCKAAGMAELEDAVALGATGKP